MSAYKIAYVVRCYNGPCMKTATHRVYDSNNRHIGDYCEKHADERIESLDQYERAAMRAPRR